MKKGIICVIALAFICFSCKDESKQKTKACFEYTPKIELTTGVEISFANCSESAKFFFWSFDDGTTSSLKEPKHKFNEKGIYRVLLMTQNSEIKDINMDEIINEGDALNTTDFVYKTITIE